MSSAQYPGERPGIVRCNEGLADTPQSVPIALDLTLAGDYELEWLRQVVGGSDAEHCHGLATEFGVPKHSPAETGACIATELPPAPESRTHRQALIGEVEG